LSLVNYEKDSTIFLYSVTIVTDFHLYYVYTYVYKKVNNEY